MAGVNERTEFLLQSGVFNDYQHKGGGAQLKKHVRKFVTNFNKTRQNLQVIKVPISQHDLIARSKKKKLPSICQHLEAIKHFRFVPSGAEPLEIHDNQGKLLGYRWRIEQKYVDTLTESDANLPKHNVKSSSTRGIKDARHYAVWGDYDVKLFLSSEWQKDEPKGGAEWRKMNEPLFRRLSNELRLLDPIMYRRATCFGFHRNHNINMSKEEAERLKPFAGAWHGVAINRGQDYNGKPHQDWGDTRLMFNGVMPYGEYSGGDLLLWQLKLRIEIKPGDVFFFLGSIIAHNCIDISSGKRSSIDVFTHKSNFYWKRRVDKRHGTRATNTRIGPYQLRSNEPVHNDNESPAEPEAEPSRSDNELSDEEEEDTIIVADTPFNADTAAAFNADTPSADPTKPPKRPRGRAVKSPAAEETPVSSENPPTATKPTPKKAAPRKGAAKAPAASERAPVNSETLSAAKPTLRERAAKVSTTTAEETAAAATKPALRKRAAKVSTTTAEETAAAATKPALRKRAAKVSAAAEKTAASPETPPAAKPTLRRRAAKVSAAAEEPAAAEETPVSSETFSAAKATRKRVAPGKRASNTSPMAEAGKRLKLSAESRKKAAVRRVSDLVVSDLVDLLG